MNPPNTKVTHFNRNFSIPAIAPSQSMKLNTVLLWLSYFISSLQYIYARTLLPFGTTKVSELKKVISKNLVQVDGIPGTQQSAASKTLSLNLMPTSLNKPSQILIAGNQLSVSSTGSLSIQKLICVFRTLEKTDLSSSHSVIALSSAHSGSMKLPLASVS